MFLEQSTIVTALHTQTTPKAFNLITVIGSSEGKVNG
jgi:hypothetical protein